MARDMRPASVRSRTNVKSAFDAVAREPASAGNDRVYSVAPPIAADSEPGDLDRCLALAMHRSTHGHPNDDSALWGETRVRRRAWKSRRQRGRSIRSGAAAHAADVPDAVAVGPARADRSAAAARLASDPRRRSGIRGRGLHRVSRFDASRDGVTS